MRIAMSSGHGKHIRGARGNPVPPQLDEVDEARKVVEATAKKLRAAGVECVTFHDDTSHDQSTNLHTIVAWHNKQQRDLDVSCHFNAYDGTVDGVEVLYLSQKTLAATVSSAIASAGPFKNRGAKYRDDLYFLGNTHEPAILVETCFCDNTSDSNKYHQNFDAICEALAESISGREVPEVPVAAPEQPAPPPTGVVAARFTGRCSYFGGPEDTTGVAADEGLAIFNEYEDAPHLFLPEQPPGTTGLARRLNPQVFYVACRWDYDVTPKSMLRDRANICRVRGNDLQAWAYPADWGPNEKKTGRAADLSPGLMEALGLQTDDEVEVIYLVQSSEVVS